MLRLDDREWKCLNFTDVFIIRKGFYNKKPVTSDAENIPFLGATANNNGVTGWCSHESIEKASRTGDDNNEPMSRKMFAGGCIAVTNNGSVGHAYYWPHEFTCSHDINPLFLKSRKMTAPLALFLIGAIEKQAVCFEYARKWRPARMVNSRIMLPVTEDGEPDYQFMEDYISERMATKKKQYREYLKKRIVELCSVPDDQTVDWKSLIESHEWEPFNMSQVFEEPQRGKRIVNENHIWGNTPLVSSQGTNNGVTNFVGNEDGVRRFQNCLSIANGGSSAGKCYYQPFEFIGADHVTQCWRLDASAAQYLFLSTIVSKALMGKYGFSHEIKDKALVRERVLLPVTDAGEPDYDFMEQFGRKMMLNKYNQYLSFLSA